jgi:hypothetical protein
MKVEQNIRFSWPSPKLFYFSFVSGSTHGEHSLFQQ